MDLSLSNASELASAVLQRRTESQMPKRQMMSGHGSAQQLKGSEGLQGLHTALLARVQPASNLQRDDQTFSCFSQACCQLKFLKRNSIMWFLGCMLQPWHDHAGPLAACQPGEQRSGEPAAAGGAGRGTCPGPGPDAGLEAGQG